MHQDFIRPKAAHNPYANQMEWAMACMFYGHAFLLLLFTPTSSLWNIQVRSHTLHCIANTASVAKYHVER